MMCKSTMSHRKHWPQHPVSPLETGETTKLSKRSATDIEGFSHGFWQEKNRWMILSCKTDVDVSENSGTPKSSILIGVSL